VVIPSNAYLDSNGTVWRCERGFKRMESACVELAVPVNAYLDYSGNEWRCEDGFNRVGDACKAGRPR
jgi:hypothetical protein